jgi:hypothetical protein
MAGGLKDTVEGAGWALPEERVYENQNFQDELDADTIYSILEEEITPMFYKRNRQGIPEQWIRVIKNSISSIAPMFTMRRMLHDYTERYYKKLYDRSRRMQENDFQIARQISAWKRRLYRGWDSIEVVEVSYPDAAHGSLMLGHEHKGEIVLDLKDLNPTSVGVELVVADIHPSNGNIDILEVHELELIGTEGSHFRYRILLDPTRAGAFQYGLRIFPRHPEMPHRQDLGFVRWI